MSLVVIVLKFKGKSVIISINKLFLNEWFGLVDLLSRAYRNWAEASTTLPVNVMTCVCLVWFFRVFYFSFVYT